MRFLHKLALFVLACLLLAVLAACGTPECTVVEAYQYDSEDVCLLSRERVEMGCYTPSEAESAHLTAFQCIYNPERNLLVFEPYISGANSKVASEPGFSKCPDKVLISIDEELGSDPENWPLCEDSEDSDSDTD